MLRLDDYTFTSDAAGAVLQYPVQCKVSATIRHACLGEPRDIFVFGKLAEEIVE